MIGNKLPKIALCPRLERDKEGDARIFRPSQLFAAVEIIVIIFAFIPHGVNKVLTSEV